MEGDGNLIDNSNAYTYTVCYTVDLWAIIQRNIWIWPIFQLLNPQKHVAVSVWAMKVCLVSPCLSVFIAFTPLYENEPAGHPCKSFLWLLLKEFFDTNLNRKPTIKATRKPGTTTELGLHVVKLLSTLFSLLLASIQLIMKSSTSS